jgi:charged multivesicular body protein 5
MKRVFGQKKATSQIPTPTLHDASSNIGKRANDLDAKIGKLDVELMGYKQKLKTTKGAARQQYQRRAMEVLKRKRMYEGQRDVAAGQQFNIKSAAFGIESARDSINTVGAMKAANVQIKQQMQQLNIDDVEDMADDLAEMMEDMNEVNDILGKSYAMPDDIDETDLEAELDLLDDELEDVDEQQSEAAPSYLSPLSEQPTTAPGGKNSARVDEYGLPV